MVDVWHINLQQFSSNRWRYTFKINPIQTLVHSKLNHIYAKTWHPIAIKLKCPHDALLKTFITRKRKATNERIKINSQLLILNKINLGAVAAIRSKYTPISKSQISNYQPLETEHAIFPVDIPVLNNLKIFSRHCKIDMNLSHYVNDS